MVVEAARKKRLDELDFEKLARSIKVCVHIPNEFRPGITE